MNTTDDNDTRTYRGRSLEEILPRIKSDLGLDALIVRQRDGLMGGVGGFFQRQCIEVDARPAPDESRGRRFDAYDEDEPAAPAPLAAHPLEQNGFVHEPAHAPDPETAEGLSSPAIQELLRQAAPFADHLSAAATPADDLDAAPMPAPAYGRLPAPQERAEQPVAARGPGRGRPPVADSVESALAGAGIASELAAAVVAETVSHKLPFSSPRAFKRLVREGLAARVPVEPVATGRGRSLAFVGPGGSGKTLCAARLAAAYAAGSDMPVICVSLRPADGGAELAALLEPRGVGVLAADSAEQARAHVAGALGHALVVVDTPAVAPGSPAEVAALASELAALGLDEVHLTVPCSFSGPAAEELVERLAPLGVSRLALTHTDSTSRIGPLLDFVIRAGTPIGYTSAGTGVDGGLEPADAGVLAQMVLP